jgi:hypothetical protein
MLVRLLSIPGSALHPDRVYWVATTDMLLHTLGLQRKPTFVT